MFICVECGTSIDIDNPQNPVIVDCPICGTELEIFENNLIGLHLGPNEE
jgi:lysine biosynthesis protein LysW